MFITNLSQRIVKQWRNYFLMLVAIGTNLVAISALIIPAAGKLPVANFKFPQSIKLNSGKVIAYPNFSDVTKSGLNSSELIAAKQNYQYILGKSKISLEINYIVDTRGDVGLYLQNYTDIAPEVIKTKKVKQIEGIGYHALFTDNNRAYLTSCISPRSLSNVTHEQFSQYRDRNDLNSEVVWQWLQGKTSIRDRRCLWVLLSTPTTKDSSQADFKALETAWQDMYQWWLPNFPNLIDRNGKKVDISSLKQNRV